MSTNSSLYRSSKYSSLIDFLESQDTENKLQFLESASESDAITAFSEAKVKIMSLRLELEEAHKTIDSLKLIIDKQQYQLEEKERSWQDKLNRELARQQQTYEETFEKNVAFIEALVKDKEQRLKVISELQLQLVKNEEGYKSAINSLQESFRKEMKKEKDAWTTTEKVKREKWEKEKTKEIKEMTARGLEPEINRIVSNHRKAMEDKEESHRKEIKKLKETMENKNSDDLKKLRENLNYKNDQMLEKERELFSNRIKEMTESQENELKNVRNRWNNELMSEKTKIESFYSEELRHWQERARAAESQLKQQ